jgi:hypothetical protein
MNCRKDLKTGGGRHRLCPGCLERCFDQRCGRTMCQTCVKRNVRKLTHALYQYDK